MELGPFLGRLHGPLAACRADSLRFQIGISKLKGCGGRRYSPYAFTQEGIAMLSLDQDKAGAGCRIRTDDRRFTKPLLYH